jgi:phosphomannomutase
MDIDSLLERAHRWIKDDPDPRTRAQGLTIAQRADPEELEAHFGTRLQFGTAGIRGPLGPGPSCMNRALVRQVTAGLGHYLLEHRAESQKEGVVIGFDGRHGSLEFAEDAARVLGGLGFQIHRFTEVSPTPALAHAVVHLGAAAGIMVTASHNPPRDNGYKVYWNNGAQISPPHDLGISEAIDRVHLNTLVLPLVSELGDRVRAVPPSTWENYLAQVLALRVHHETGARAVYTAMHGVGWIMIRDVLVAAGHCAPIAVPEQRDPDGDFPTVDFPNPEEPGALDLAMRLAEQEGADLIIANDPDADRLAVAVPTSDGWQMLSGNEVGLLLAEDLLRHGPKEPHRLVANTIVSSSLLADIAQAHGARYAETLTGFKWIANAALAHDGPFVIGFEEALGYSVGPVVRDKDGVSAALILLDLASHARSQGRTLIDCLEALYRRYGYIAAHQHAVTLPGDAGAKQIQQIMDQLRQNPPRTLAGQTVIAVRDLQMRTCKDLRTGEVQAEMLPQSNVLALILEGGDRVLARPSGTEPKIKFYFEARVKIGLNDTIQEARQQAWKRISQLQSDLIDRRFPVLS